MTTQEQALTVDGWEFRLANDQLSITSQSDPSRQVQISTQGAFALLGYLSQHRDSLYWAAHQGVRDEPEHDWRQPLADGEAIGQEEEG
jgi:hypothetical protein